MSGWRLSNRVAYKNVEGVSGQWRALRLERKLPKNIVGWKFETILVFKLFLYIEHNHWSLFFLCARFWPAVIGLYMLIIWLSTVDQFSIMSNISKTDVPAIKLWERFIDDCIGNWRGSRRSFAMFVKTLNQETMKFSASNFPSKKFSLEKRWIFWTWQFT